MARNLDKLESKVGYHFLDSRLLDRALTHRSFSAFNNERLEFLGDSVLGVIVSAILYRLYSESEEEIINNKNVHSRCERQETESLHPANPEAGGQALNTTSEQARVRMREGGRGFRFHAIRVYSITFLVYHVAAAAIQRSRRLRKRAGIYSNSDTKKSLEKIAFQKANEGFKAFKIWAESPGIGIVLTAHPTFSLSRDIRKCLGVIASSQESKYNSSVEELKGFPYLPKRAPTLKEEHEDTQETLERIQIELDNVVDLIKLHIVFDNFKFKKKNIRKCMIELRPNIPGKYKGLIYCQSLEEAEEVSRNLLFVTKNNFNKKISLNIKRGCSEFSVKFPKYNNLKKDIMNYDANSKKYEDKFDKENIELGLNKKTRSTIKGITLYDALVIRNWLAYAKIIGDDTYKLISDKVFYSKTIEEKVKTKLLKESQLN